MTTIQTIHQYRCDLSQGPSEVTLKAPVMHQDALGDVFRAAVRRGSQPLDLSGMTVRGFLYFASTRQTLLLEGSVVDGQASVALTSECYAVPGYASLVVQVQDGEVRHSVLKVNMCITRTATDSVLDPGEMLPTLPELLEVAAQINAALEQLPSLDGVSLGGGQRVYCWGDSLTQGYGGNIAAGSNYYHAMSYPQEIGQKCNAINLGVMSENVPTICARIGSNPILLPACTIPADHTQGVKIGTLADGLPTQGGRTAKVCRYHEAGVNPCWVNGVKCILYRSYSTSTPDTEYYIRRYEDGAAVTVAEGTPLETYGARYYKGGIHIFWMGANYGFSSVQEYLSYLTDAIEYVEADDYLVVYARCFANGFQGENEEQVKAHIIEAVGAEHFIDLLPALKDRGLLYGEVYLWDGSMTSGVPSPLDSGDGLHYSYAGYKAIAGVIWEHLQPLLEVTTGSSGGSGSGGTGGSGDSGGSGDAGDTGDTGDTGDDNTGGDSGGTGDSGDSGNTAGDNTGGGTDDDDGTGDSGDDTSDIGASVLLMNGTDDYGTYAAKMDASAGSAALSSTAYIDTKYKVYETETEQDCTIALAVEGNPGAGVNLLGCSYSPLSGGYSDNRGLAVYKKTDEWTCTMGSNSFNFASGGVSMNDTGTNVIIIRKSAGTYGMWCNGTVLYGNSSIGSSMDGTDFLRDLTLLIGATPTYPGKVTKNSTTITVKDLRVYTSALTTEQIAQLNTEMAAL